MTAITDEGKPAAPPFLLRAAAFILLVALLPLAGCGRPGHGAPSGGAEIRPSQVKLKRNVELDQVQVLPLASTVESVGYLDAEGQTEIAAGVSGVVEEVLFREGDWVVKDQTLLVRVEPKRYEAMLAQADANVER